MDFLKNSQMWSTTGVPHMIGQGDLKSSTSWGSVAKALGLIGAGCAASVGLYAYFQRQARKIEEETKLRLRECSALTNTNDRISWLQVDPEAHEARLVQRMGSLTPNSRGRTTLKKTVRTKAGLSDSEHMGERSTPQNTSCETPDKGGFTPLSWSGGSTRALDRVSCSPGLNDYLCRQDVPYALSVGSSSVDQSSPKTFYKDIVQRYPFVQGSSLKDLYESYLSERTEEKNINCNNPNNPPHLGNKRHQELNRLRPEHSDIYPASFPAEKVSVMKASPSLDTNFQRWGHLFKSADSKSDMSNPYKECIATCSKDLSGTPVDEAHLLAKYLALNCSEDGSPVDVMYLCPSPKRKPADNESNDVTAVNTENAASATPRAESASAGDTGSQSGTKLASSSYTIGQTSPIDFDPDPSALSKPTIDKYISTMRAPAHKVLLMGLPGSGKSTLLSAWATMTNQEVMVEDGNSTANIPIAKQRFSIMEVDGSKQGRKKWPNFYEGVEAIIFVMDSTAGLSVRELEVKAVQGLLAEPKLRGVPLLLLIHKQDSPLAHNCMEIANPLQLNRISPRKRVVKVLPTQVPSMNDETVGKKRSQETVENLNLGAAKNVDKAARYLAGMVTEVKTEV